MLCYPQLAQDSKEFQVKNVGYSVGELRAYSEPTKEKASTAQKMRKNRRIEERRARLVSQSMSDVFCSLIKRRCKTQNRKTTHSAPCCGQMSEWAEQEKVINPASMGIPCCLYLHKWKLKESKLKQSYRNLHKTSVVDVCIDKTKYLLYFNI